MGNSKFCYDDFEFKYFGKNRNITILFLASGTYYPAIAQTYTDPCEPAETEVDDVKVIAFVKRGEIVYRANRPDLVNWWNWLDLLVMEECNYRRQREVINKVEFYQCKQ